jgi:hypothetical protein
MKINRSRQHTGEQFVLIDWVLCIIATVGVCLIFAGVLIGASFELGVGSLLKWTTIAIAFYPVGCSIGFLVCSYFDFRLMRAAVARAFILEGSDAGLADRQAFPVNSATHRTLVAESGTGINNDFGKIDIVAPQ